MIIGKACQRQIAGDRLPTVLLSDNLVDLQLNRGASLRQAAIFAAIVCPSPDKFDEVLRDSRHEVVDRRLSTRRA